MKKYFLLMLLLIVLPGCNKFEIAEGTPKCVENKIKDFAKGPCDNGVNVKEYSFQNKTVYVFDPGTCGADMSAEVIDSDCNGLGALGGFSGNTVINGEDFSNAIFQKIIWEK